MTTDRKDLKIQALNEVISQLQNTVADLRVELTIVSNAKDEEILDLRNQLESDATVNTELEDHVEADQKPTSS